MKIKKVINNNVLCAIDASGNEMIVTGKGIGFRRVVGEWIDEGTVDKIYRMEDSGQQRKLRELLTQIPLEDLTLTERLLTEIHHTIDKTINPSILITLADHISFAMKRKAEGIEFTNPLTAMIVACYPEEYRMGCRCVEMIREERGISLNPEEASFIALHIVNAELNTEISQMNDITRLIDGCIEITEEYYGRTFDRESLDFSRFMVHLRYFSQRVFQNKLLESDPNDADPAFQQMIVRSYNRHYSCAKHMAAFIKNTWGIELTDEELVFLTIHLKRINMSDRK